ncbi:MAG: S8 family serine peptidase [Rubrivivax sp.]|nr:S8 family serine peptidase [Rubrivivax sp.]
MRVLSRCIGAAAVSLGATTAWAQPAPSQALDELASRAASQGSVRVIVGLDMVTRAEAVLGAAAAQQQRRDIGNAQAAAVAQLLTNTLSRVKARFETVPYMALEVDANALARLRASPLIRHIQEDALDAPSMLQSNPLINAPTAWGRGFIGTGWAVAVLDTGVDKSHEFLAGKVVSEACYSTTSGTTSESVCPGGAASSTAAGSGVHCTGSADCPHGTHVAGTAAGGTRPSDGSHGVAYGANIIAMQVFSRFPNYNGSGQTRMLSYSSDQMLALERVYALRNTYNIAAVNMSLGGGNFASNCDSDSRKAIIDNLRAAGIATVASAGNSYYTASMGAPACISSAISVGATCDSAGGWACATGVNGIAAYSNIASFVSLLAPGSYITSSVPGNAYSEYNGTSMAAPHVAGAWALYKQWKPGSSVTDALNEFRSNGLTVNDTRSGGTVTGMKRIDLAFIGAASSFPLTVTRAGAAAASGTVTSAPAGINCGADCSESYPSGTSVTLTAAAGSGAVFAGWSGACSGTAATCTVSMSAARAVTATFDAPPSTTVSFSAASYSVNEGSATVAITVTRSSGVGTASVSFATANGTAQAGSDYTARSGVVSFAAGVTSRTFTVAITNDTAVEGNETFSVSLSSPTGATLGSPSTTTVTIVDNDTAPAATLQLSAASYSVNEGAGTATITVNRSSGTGTASVSYATSNGTATAGADYSATSGVLSFGSGVTSASFTVPIINDSTPEATETFTVTLSAPSGATLASPSSATVSIVDNDSAPTATIQFSSASYSVNEGAGTVTVSVTRSSGTGAASVNYATSNGTATAGADYTATSGTLSFSSGVTTASFTVPITNDSTVEPNETFTVSLSSPVGGSLGSPGTATVTIVDNDTAPSTTVQFHSATYSVNEGASTVAITVTRSSGVGTASVSFATSNLSALAGSDYVSRTGVLSFAEGVTSRTFTVAIVNNTIAEPSETFRITLSSPVGATLGANSQATVTIIDND